MSEDRLAEAPVYHRRRFPGAKGASQSFAAQADLQPVTATAPRRAILMSLQNEGSVATNHEAIIEFSKIAIDHTASLWTIAGGFIALEVLLIAQIQTRTREPFRSRVSLWLSVSTVANVLSMVFGYLSDAAVLDALERYASSDRWESSWHAELFNYLQMLALSIGLLVFLVVFLRDSRTMSNNLIQAGGLQPKSGESSRSDD